MVTVVKGKSYRKTNSFLERTKEAFKAGRLDNYGRLGVEALEAATPRDTGKTAASWYYTIERTKNGESVVWRNSNFEEGYPIAILIQYGHGTGSGAYVKGVDYINPAMAPIFEQIANDMWKEVSKH